LGTKLIIGSSSRVHIVLRDGSVSRLHAQLEARTDGLWGTDLGSTNGTFVQGGRVVGARVWEGGPVAFGGVEAVVQSALAAAAPDEVWPEPELGPLLGASEPMRRLFAVLARAAASDATLLVEAETGSGKELVAQAVHDTSPRCEQPFVIVDCAAL